MKRKPPNQRLKSTTMYLPSSTIKAFNLLSEEIGISAAYMMRECIEAGLPQWQEFGKHLNLEAANIRAELRRLIHGSTLSALNRARMAAEIQAAERGGAV